MNSDFAESAPITTKNKVGRRVSKQSICLVCGEVARIINYGALCCQACKTFFRRNVSHGKQVCQYDGNCEITKFTRLGCTACRLKKCFACGMNPEFIRVTDQNTNHALVKRRNKKTNDDDNNGEKLKINLFPPKLQTLDLLENDRSALSHFEWTLLSNVIHAYDRFEASSKISTSTNYLVHLPVETLFHNTHTYNLFKTYYTTAQLFVASSADYKILTSAEQCSLLKRNLNGLFIFCAEVVCRDLKMLEHPVWFNTLTYSLGSGMVARKRYLNKKLEHDNTLIKLMLIVLAFSSNCCMLDERDGVFQDHLLIGTFRLFGSQNVFVEILWKYMLYRYGYRETVRRFSGLVKQTLDLISLVVNMYRSDRMHQYFLDEAIKLATSSVKIGENDSIPLWGKSSLDSIESTPMTFGYYCT
ncbi:unnamed protein product [Adineta ricciae]|uniref:Nuclear receptor domain-containing protein n=1 Tax=Adineta ricciae TaxID=249248 RepID=A0A816A0G2_ADIRI|nr:unnamed protein product [Adineta ricciae]